MSPLGELLRVLAGTLRDVVPIVTLLTGFQLLVLRRPLPSPKRLLLGIAYALVGLTLFLLGLEQALFPLGRIMAVQLTDVAFIADFAEDAGIAPGDWRAYFWVYVFACAISFSTTLAEPALIAVALKAEELSAGAVRARGLRIAVALGVALGVTLGAVRVVVGGSLPAWIGLGYAVVVAQTLFAPRFIVALAFDSGGVTTSTVTVPLLAALGLGLAEAVPGRNPLVEGFGLIAFASLCPMMSVLAYAQASAWRATLGRPPGAREQARAPASQGGSA